mmetsp:Transcript_36611/g.105312  ORF Transcript_36611/g.105312 Transcript_36611/m.105312 type:complete len:252 (-) Transcript_36611:1144-1899(-)
MELYKRLLHLLDGHETITILVEELEGLLQRGFPLQQRLERSGDGLHLEGHVALVLQDHREARKEIAKVQLGIVIAASEELPRALVLEDWAQDAREDRQPLGVRYHRPLAFQLVQLRKELGLALDDQAHQLLTLQGPGVVPQRLLVVVVHFLSELYPLLHRLALADEPGDVLEWRRVVLVECVVREAPALEDHNSALVAILAGVVRGAEERDDPVVVHAGVARVGVRDLVGADDEVNGRVVLEEALRDVRPP